MLDRLYSRYFSLALPALILLAGLLVRPALALAQVVPQMRGVYGANLSNTQAPSVLANSNIDGVQIVEPWSSVEATEGVFDWSAIDTFVTQAASYGKKISLGIQAGAYTPSWVYSDGAQAFPFIWDKPTTTPVTCSAQNIPVPWDPVFLSKWQALIVALGAHYAANPTVASVVIYGVNSSTVETTLPISVNEVIVNGTISCTGPNYPANWQAAGYTRTLIENAIETMQGYFAQAFPHIQLLAALNPSGFPPIDQNGALLATSADFQAPQDLLSYGVNKLGLQFAAGNGGLSANWVWSLIAGYGATLDVGFQTVTPLGASLIGAGNLALGGGASWIELYGTDILDSTLQTELASLHQALNP